MAAMERTCVVVTDANVLINLIHVGRLDLLGALAGYEFVVPPEVVAEVSVPEQAQTLRHAVEAGHIEQRAFSGTAELEVYAELSLVIGKGEAACLAMAKIKGWYVASDERGRFLRIAEESLGPGHLLNTAGIFVLAIRCDLVTVEETDQSKRILEEHRFMMRFSSFRDVIGNLDK